jgi:hypothetical protein
LSIDLCSDPTSEFQTPTTAIAIAPRACLLTRPIRGRPKNQPCQIVMEHGMNLQVASTPTIRTARPSVVSHKNILRVSVVENDACLSLRESSQPLHGQEKHTTDPARQHQKCSLEFGRARKSSYIPLNDCQKRKLLFFGSLRENRGKET